MAGQAAWRIPAGQETEVPARHSPSTKWQCEELVIEALDAEAVTRHAEAWADLASRCLEPNPFMEPGFCLPAARHLVPPGTLTFVLVWESGSEATRRLLAVCPLARSRLPGWPVAAVWFHDLAALGAPLFCREAAAPAFLALLAWMARNLPRRAALGVTALAGDGPTHRLLIASARQTGREVHFLDERRRAILPGAPAPMPVGLAALPARRAKELQRQRRRLMERGSLRYQSATRPDAIAAVLEDFLALEARGWKGRAGTALVNGDGRAAFVRQMVEQMTAQGRCRIDALLLDARPIAMGIILSSRDHDFFWKTAYDEDHAPLSPGVQFVLDLTRLQQSRHALASTDSCAIPDHPMIDRLWPDRLPVVDALIAITPGRSLAYRMSLRLERARRWSRARIKSLRGRLLAAPAAVRKRLRPG